MSKGRTREAQLGYHIWQKVTVRSLGILPIPEVKARQISDSFFAKTDEFHRRTNTDIPHYYFPSPQLSYVKDETERRTHEYMQNVLKRNGIIDRAPVMFKYASGTGSKAGKLDELHGVPVIYPDNAVELYSFGERMESEREKVRDISTSDLDEPRARFLQVLQAADLDAIKLDGKYGLAGTIAHEGSHAAMGIRYVIHVGRRGNHDLERIVGLDRLTARNGDLVTHTGALLENAFAVYDSAQIVSSLVAEDTGRFSKIFEGASQTANTQSIIKAYTTINDLAEITSAGKRPETPQTNKSSDEQRIIDSIETTKAFGVPENLMAVIVDPDEIYQLQFFYRLSRIIGREIAGANRGNSLSPQDAFVAGAAFLEQSRVNGTTEAQDIIGKIFGRNANLILTGNDHPEQEEMTAILNLLKTKE